MIQGLDSSLNQTVMLLLPVTFFFFILTPSIAVDTVVLNRSIRDGETIVSQKETFELGFFSPRRTKNRYLGIWYKKIKPQTVVWVANRENPLKSTSGIFMFNSERILLLLESTGDIIWSCNFSIPLTNTTPVAQLLENGNFIIKDNSDGSENRYIWQSFDYPGNTYLPGMQFGKDFLTGRDRYLTSWRSIDDPSPGDYSYRLVMNAYPQVYKMKGSVIETRVGPWNGAKHAGVPKFEDPSDIYKMEYIINYDQKEAYFIYMLNSTRFLERYVMGQEGRFEYWHYVTGDIDWMLVMALPLDNCDRYGLCGPFGSCNTITSPLCGCLTGFEPKAEWRFDFWASGCQRKIALDCSPDEGFFKVTDVKLPDTQGAWFNESITLKECEVACKNNCSCTAYANPYVAAGKRGCLLWFGDLIDIRVYQQDRQDLYIRLAGSQLLDLHSGSNWKLKAFLSTSSMVVVSGLILVLYVGIKRKKRSKVDRKGNLKKLIDRDHNDSSEMGDTELTLFNLSKIVFATSNFSIDNKLGEGGFGPVYKGVLDSGQEIAVKRLAKSSQQGLEEFRNEIDCIAKLQHRNLVKILGYCIQGDETMLVYEYVPNKSLDHFIFDDSMKLLLDWPQRFCIIQGIARGLLYLHQDSRLRIIHRDLKAGNILLDADMNPKISDFGLARMLRGHEVEAKTNKVVGTLGYISPEYAINGLFSVKSDIFSFGVLLLEIVSGKKNREFSYEDHHDNLLGHAWRLYRAGKSLDLVDESLGGSWSVSQVIRSVNVGLLCVQRRPEDRPSMSSVLFMLGGEGSVLPPPKRPAFFTGGSGSTSIIPSPSSNNQVTVTQLQGR